MWNSVCITHLFDWVEWLIKIDGLAGPQSTPMQWWTSNWGSPTQNTGYLVEWTTVAQTVCILIRCVHCILPREMRLFKSVFYSNGTWIWLVIWDHILWTFANTLYTATVCTRTCSSMWRANNEQNQKNLPGFGCCIRICQHCISDQQR